MSDELRAVIADESVLRAASVDLAQARWAPLGQGLSLMPVRDDPRHDRLAAWSAAGPVALVAAEYFGGVGEQEAAVWAEGDLVLGPPRAEEAQPFPADGSPISQALRRLGVRARGGADEFSAVGPGRHRYSHRWLA